MDEDGFIDPTPDNPVEAARFLSFLDLTPILAVLEGFYCEPRPFQTYEMGISNL